MGKYILIIEDEPGISGLERRYLEKAGFEVKIAATGREGLMNLGDGRPPDLLIIDLRLPDMPGIEVMQKVKDMGKSIPSIIVTGAGDEKIAVSAMKLGAMDYIIKGPDTIKQLPKTCAEVLRKFSLAEENARLTEETKKLNSELLEANRQLCELSRKDELTGLYNRRCLNSLLEREVSKAHRYNIPLSFALLDLDHFKDVNDTYGHPMGDLVLRQFAGVLTGRLRNTDMLGRFGGEEFGLILTGTQVDDAVYVCDELRKLIAAAQFGNKENPLRITTSAGVAVLTPEMDMDVLVETADKSLYRAKKSGRNRVAALQKEAKAKATRR